MSIAIVHRPTSLSINPPTPPQIYLWFSFSFPSECRGFTCISEDSSEITFLLVENYNLTAPVGFRPGREFLDPFLSAGICHFLHFHRPTWGEARKVSRLCGTIFACTVKVTSWYMQQFVYLDNNSIFHRRLACVSSVTQYPG